MLTNLKDLLREVLIRRCCFAWNLWQRLKDSHELSTWERAGKPAPPPHIVKQHILSTYASAFSTDVLIETGTYLGQMVYAMRNRFRTILSIELGGDLARRARHRFRDDAHIRILQGDSGEVLPELLNNISTQSLFWLDGHYSGGFTAKGKTGTPVMREMRTILDHRIKNHVILIDDARCFDGTQDYPIVDELRELIAAHRPGYDFSISNDVIRIHPRKVVRAEF